MLFTGTISPYDRSCPPIFCLTPYRCRERPQVGPGNKDDAKNKLPRRYVLSIAVFIGTYHMSSYLGMQHTPTGLKGASSVPDADLGTTFIGALGCP